MNTYPLGLPFPLLVRQSHLGLVLPIHEYQIKQKERKKKIREDQCIFSCLSDMKWKPWLVNSPICHYNNFLKAFVPEAYIRAKCVELSALYAWANIYASLCTHKQKLKWISKTVCILIYCTSGLMGGSDAEVFKMLCASCQWGTTPQHSPALLSALHLPSLPLDSKFLLESLHW